MSGVDYRELLKKYIGHVRNNAPEQDAFVFSRPVAGYCNHEGPFFTDEEWRELQALEAESNRC